MAEGEVKLVVAAYQSFLDKQETKDEVIGAASQLFAENEPAASTSGHAVSGHARLKSVQVEVDGKCCRHTIASSEQSTLSASVSFVSDLHIPCPTVGITLHLIDGRVLASAGTFEDGIVLSRKDNGDGAVSLVISNLPLLKGEYMLSVFLLCERGIHLYDSALSIATIRVQQQGRLQGYFALAHQWIFNDEI